MKRNNPIISKVVNNSLASKRIINDTNSSTLRILDELIAKNKNSENFSLEFLIQAKQELKSFINTGYNMTKAAVLVPVGLWGLSTGFNFPDTDITLLGIGNHRFFMFHSAFAPLILRKLYNLWIEKQNNSHDFLSRVSNKVAGMALGTYAIGVGIHLTVDVFQPKTIVFPFFGSLVSGTLIDDNLWLLGNSLWAYKIGKDVFALTLADEISTAKEYIKNKFGTAFNYNDLEVIK